jgi:hypothetical protein
VDDDDYHADDEEPEGVRNSATVADGDKKYSWDEVRRLLDKRDRRNE